MSQKNALEWVNENFGNLPFSDVRRGRRAMKIAAAMTNSPGKSIPSICENFYEVKATYDFFKHAEAIPDILQATHRKLLHHAMTQEGEYLLIEDTSDMSYSTKRKTISGLGPIGHGKGSMQGFHLHTTLAAKWVPFKSGATFKKPSIEVLGLADQQYDVRQLIPKKNGKKIPRKSSSKILASKKESAVWELALERIPKPILEKNVRYVRVCDRGADIYEVLHDSKKNGFGFVIRASQNRSLVNSSLKLFEYASLAESIGSFDLFLRTRLDQPAYTANLNVSMQTVTIRSSQRPGFPAGKLPDVKCSVIRVFESMPTAGKEPLEWFLLCDKETISFEEAINCVLQYSCRWLVEDFHKALKTCVGAEKLQLESADRLFAAVAIMSVIALRLISLREQFRINALRPAEESGLTKLEQKVLALYLKRAIKTIHDVSMAIGRLGGHLNRKSDKQPGLLTLWRGMLKLQGLVEGYKMAIESMI